MVMTLLILLARLPWTDTAAGWEGFRHIGRRFGKSRADLEGPYR